MFVEVDGYAYHWSPEQKRYDDARRNKLWLRGFTVLVYDWQRSGQRTRPAWWLKSDRP